MSNLELVPQCVQTGAFVANFFGGVGGRSTAVNTASITFAPALGTGAAPTTVPVSDFVPLSTVRAERRGPPNKRGVRYKCASL